MEPLREPNSQVLEEIGAVLNPHTETNPPIRDPPASIRRKTTRPDQFSRSGHPTSRHTGWFLMVLSMLTEPMLSRHVVDDSCSPLLPEKFLSEFLTQEHCRGPYECPERIGGDQSKSLAVHPATKDYIRRYLSQGPRQDAAEKEDSAVGTGASTLAGTG